MSSASHVPALGQGSPAFARSSLSVCAGRLSPQATWTFSVLFDARYSEPQTDRFVDALNMFKIGWSWGGANSLCVPYRIAAMRKGWQGQGGLVRFNIDLEDPAELIADIEQAFAAM